MKVNMLTLEDNDYPARLRNIPTPPKQLYLIGNPSLLNSNNSLSVVGSRKVTSYGKQVTLDLVETLAAYNVVIVSGLALGVDSLAHQAALNAGGKTIAVMPSGLNNIYPSSHRNLALRILENDGLLVTEYEPDMPALKQNFIARNRIISGLGDGLLITEAGVRSGTIHTANFGLEQGKPVMAVPGNITSSQSEGTNNLIRTGATPITCSQDILNSLDLELANTKKEVIAHNQAEEEILTLIQQGVSDINELIDKSTLDIRTFNQTVSMLEITRKIRPLGSGHWAIY